MTGHRRTKRGRTSPNPPAKRCRGGRGPRELRVQRAAACSGTGAGSGCGSAAVVSDGRRAAARVRRDGAQVAAGGVRPHRAHPHDAAAATGYVTFRSDAAAVAAIAASLDPDGGITVGSKKVLVVQASETPNNSKSVVRDDPAEATLHDETKNNASGASAIQSSKEAPEAIYKAREIVAL